MGETQPALEFLKKKKNPNNKTYGHFILLFSLYAEIIIFYLHLCLLKMRVYMQVQVFEGFIKQPVQPYEPKYFSFLLFLVFLFFIFLVF